MKFVGQISTGQFEYLNFEMEGGTAEDAVAAYHDLKRAWEGGEGLPQKEWCKLRDNYLRTGKMDGDPGELEKLSRAQAWFINEAKKAFKNNNN